MVRPAVLLVAALAGMPALGTEALHCSAGNRLESRDYPKGERKEWCVDETSGLKEGPERDLRPDGSLASLGENRAGKHHGIARIYDPGDVLIVEMEFDKGKVRAMRYTEYGLKSKIADPLNRQFRDEGDPTEIYVVDESTMGINIPQMDTKLSRSECNSAQQ